MKKLLRFLLSFLLFFPCLSFGVTKTIDSFPQAIFTLPSSITVQLLKPSTTGSPALISGQKVSMVPSVGWLIVTAQFPGQTTAPMTVWGIRVTFSASGNGWSGKALSVDIPLADTVPIGKTYTVTYNTLTGDLTGTPGVPGVTGTTNPPPAPAPTPTPAPVPTPTGQSPTGATCPTVCPLIDKNGIAWKIVGNSVTANGIAIPLPGGYSDSNSLSMQGNGLVRIISPSRGYFCTTAAGVVIDC